MWKEARQIVRDPSSIAMGVILPLILILLFGFGLSLDVKDVPLAVVVAAALERGDESDRGAAAVAVFSSATAARHATGRAAADERSGRRHPA